MKIGSCKIVAPSCETLGVQLHPMEVFLSTFSRCIFTALIMFIRYVDYAIGFGFILQMKISEEFDGNCSLQLSLGVLVPIFAAN